MKLLRRDEIVAIQDLEHEDVPTPEWGADTGVRIRAGGAEERDEFDRSIVQRKGKDVDVNTKQMRVKLIARAAVDTDGKPLFSEADLEVLGRKNARVIIRLYDVAARLWGVTKADVAELAGESKPGLKPEPGTASPGNGASATLVTSAAN